MSISTSRRRAPSLSSSRPPGSSRTLVMEPSCSVETALAVAMRLTGGPWPSLVLREERQSEQSEESPSSDRGPSISRMRPRLRRVAAPLGMTRLSVGRIAIPRFARADNSARDDISARNDGLIGCNSSANTGPKPPGPNPPPPPPTAHIQPVPFRTETRYRGSSMFTICGGSLRRCSSVSSARIVGTSADQHVDLRVTRLEIAVVGGVIVEVASAAPRDSAPPAPRSSPSDRCTADSSPRCCRPDATSGAASPAAGGSSPSGSACRAEPNDRKRLLGQPRARLRPAGAELHPQVLPLAHGPEIVAHASPSASPGCAARGTAGASRRSAD